MSELTNKSSFKELENYFIENMEMLPNTLDSECKYYSNVKATAELYLVRINSEIEKLGIKGIRKSAIAKTSKSNLFALYEDLQDISKWDAPRPKLNLLNQRI